jgi:hypothetical protein
MPYSSARSLGMVACNWQIFIHYKMFSYFFYCFWWPKSSYAHPFRPNLWA